MPSFLTPYIDSLSIKHISNPEHSLALFDLGRIQAEARALLV